ncbi:MAG: CoA transferase, partial [Streptosporangiaceae bacterium]
MSVLSALHERARSGLGQRVTATVFEANAAIGQNLVSQYSYNGSYETRRQYPGFLALLECSDYRMVLFAIRHWEQLCAVFGLEHLLGDERFARQADRLENWDLVVTQMQERAGSRSAGELVAALQKARISAEVIAPLGRLVSSPQWRARQVVQVASEANGRTEAALREPFTVGDTEYCAVRPSPPLRRGRAGERAARQIQRRWRALAPACSGPVDSGPVDCGAGPLSGLRVVDLTTAWAGPFAARSLAQLGAEVIKIDAPSHTDSWRGAPQGGAARYYPDGQPGERPWNRCLLFNTQGQGKLSLGLDLKIEGAREIMLQLAEVSDVLIANFTPGVLERLGIGYDTLSARNPRIIVVEMPAFGPGGPDSAHQGMGKTMEPASGMTALMGYGDGQPVLTGPAYLDPIGGLSAVAATMVALQQRRATGRGCRAEVPQTEAGAHWIGEQVLLQAGTGQSWQPDGCCSTFPVLCQTMPKSWLMPWRYRSRTLRLLARSSSASKRSAAPVPTAVTGTTAAAGSAAQGAGSLQVLVEPAAGVGAVYQLITGARSSVNLTMYELNDPTAEADLAADAGRGVDVRVILDQHLERSANAGAYAYLAGHGVH